MLSFHLPRHRTLQTGIIGFYEEIKGEGDTHTSGILLSPKCFQKSKYLESDKDINYIPADVAKIVRDYINRILRLVLCIILTARALPPNVRRQVTQNSDLFENHCLILMCQYGSVVSRDV